MSMPQIPESKNRPNFEETIIDLLESIALEEIAISHILNSEGERMQSIIKKFSNNEICINQLHSSCSSTREMINTLIMKEWLLYNKMNSVIEMKDKHSHNHSENTPYEELLKPKESRIIVKQNID